MCCGYSRALRADTVLRSVPGQGLESDGAEPRRATAVRSNCVITTLPNRCGRKTKAATRSRVGRLYRACSLSLRRGRPQRYSDSTSAPRRGVGITCGELRHLPGPWFGVHGAVWPPATVARANAAMPTAISTLRVGSPGSGRSDAGFSEIKVSWALRLEWEAHFKLHLTAHIAT